jgi:hypothetical protein
MGFICMEGACGEKSSKRLLCVGGRPARAIPQLRLPCRGAPPAGSDHLFRPWKWWSACHRAPRLLRWLHAYRPIGRDPRCRLFIGVLLIVVADHHFRELRKRVWLLFSGDLG